MEAAQTTIERYGKIPASVPEALIKSIRMLARTGKQDFKQFLIDPLVEAGWKRDYSNETSPRLMRRIEQMENNPSRRSSIAPHSKRMLSQALEEGFTPVGNGVIFFLERIPRFREVAVAEESHELLAVIQPPLEHYERHTRERISERFKERLDRSSRSELEEVIDPVHLGRQKKLIELQEEARILFEKIKTANGRQDMDSCRKLISAYLIRYGDQENNNRDEIEQLIDAFEKREPGFRKELSDTIAINLYYQITKGIAGADLMQAIRGIKKYAFIFEGKPDALYSKDIGRLEGNLYDILRKKNLMQEFIRAV